MSFDDSPLSNTSSVFPSLRMTSAEKLEAVYQILNEIQEKYLYVSDLNGIDLAFIIADLGYDFIKSPTVV